MKKLMIILGFLTTASTGAAENASYFRVWQGFTKPVMSEGEFHQQLLPFMHGTTRLYQGRALSNYLVVIPPASKPHFIPDELALISLTSKEDYQKIRYSEEGKEYAATHWDLFDRHTSKSARHMIDFSAEQPEQLNHNWAYDMIGKDIDWSEGANYVYVGVRKLKYKEGEFLQRLKQHIQLAKETMEPKGLRGYMVIANKNYEVAYLNWESKEAMEAATATPEGQFVFEDAAEIMDTLMWQESRSIPPSGSVEAGSFYHAL